MRRSLSILLAAVVLASLAASPALAASKTTGKAGAKPAPATLAYVMVYDANGNGLPNWNDSVTWKFTQTSTTQPHVELLCYQNSKLVYSEATGFYAGYPWPWTNTMKLASMAWSSGAASCTGKLYYLYGTKTVILATTTFSVGA